MDVEYVETPFNNVFQTKQNFRQNTCLKVIFNVVCV